MAKNKAKNKARTFGTPSRPLAVEPEPERAVDLAGIPTIAHSHVKAGCEYLGVDCDGVHIVHNESGYHRIASDDIQLDLLGDGLPKEYLASLKK